MIQPVTSYDKLITKSQKGLHERPSPILHTTKGSATAGEGSLFEYAAVRAGSKIIPKLYGTRPPGVVKWCLVEL